MTRRGFSLVETMMALVLAVAVSAIVLSIGARHLRGYTAVMALAEMRSTLADGRDVLLTDLRTGSRADTLLFASDTAVELEVSIGASTLCSPASGGQLMLAPDSVASGAVLTSWLSIPDTADLLLAYTSPSASPPNGAWRRFRIVHVSALPAATACPPSTGLTTLADGARDAYAITYATSDPLDVQRGAPVRVLRRARYSVYRAGDGEWYLGYHRCGTTGCATIQPFAGPYHSLTAAPPLTLRYFDGSGAEAAARGSVSGVARVDFVLRVASPGALSLSGLARGVARDSIIASVAFRN